MRYLIGLGHKRVARLLPREHVRPGRERAAGYRQALTEAGIAVDPELIRPQKTSVHFSYADIEKLLQGPHPPTDIIVLGTRMLAGAIGRESCRERVCALRLNLGGRRLNKKKNNKIQTQ